MWNFTTKYKLFTFISKVFFILLIVISVFALEYAISKGQANQDGW